MLVHGHGMCIQLIISPSYFHLISSISLSYPRVLNGCGLSTPEHLPAGLCYHGSIVDAVTRSCHKPSLVCPSSMPLWLHC